MDLAPIIVSYSELDTFRQCPLKHHLAYGQRWSKSPKDDGALAKGTLYHKVMEAHYRTLKAAQDTGSQITDSFRERPIMDACRKAAFAHLFDPQSGEQSDVQGLIQWMYEGYVQNYRLDPDWKILAVEHNAVVPLRDARGHRTRYHLKVKIDLIVRDGNGALWVVDHKSGKDLPSSMDLEIDDQFGLYTWALRELGKPITGSIHAANRTQRNKGPMTLDARMSRTYLNRTEIELTNLALDAYEAARTAHPPKSARPTRYSSPDPRQCGWKCDFKEPHLLMRQGRDPQEVLLEYGFQIDRRRH